MKQIILIAIALCLIAPDSDASRRRIMMGKAVKGASGGGGSPTFPPDAVVFYNLDEASGDATDDIGSNDLTDFNGVTSGAGILGTARSFVNASSQALYHSDNATFSTGDVDFSVSVWFRTTTVAGSFRIVCGQQDAWYIFQNDAALVFRTGTAGAPDDLTSSVTLSANTWYHVVVTFTAAGNGKSVTVNAGTPTTNSGGAAPTDSSSIFEVGSYGGGGSFYFDGRIDLLGLWKRVLTSQEHTDLYNGGAGLQP
jgi:hypothetical protein